MSDDDNARVRAAFFCGSHDAVDRLGEVGASDTRRGVTPVPKRGKNIARDGLSPPRHIDTDVGTCLRPRDLRLMLLHARKPCIFALRKLLHQCFEVIQVFLFFVIWRGVVLPSMREDHNHYIACPLLLLADKVERAGKLATVRLGEGSALLPRLPHVIELDDAELELGRRASYERRGLYCSRARAIDLVRHTTGEQSEYCKAGKYKTAIQHEVHQ